MSRLRIGVVTARPASGEQGGAERFYDALVAALRAAGHSVSELPVPTDEATFENIKQSYVYAYDLDVSNYDLVISTKAPSWLVRHPRHVCYLVHTIRVFYDMYEDAFGSGSEDQCKQRSLVHALDTGALSPPRCKAVFTIGEEVSARLRAANCIESEVLHPPLWSDAFSAGDAQGYILVPGRLHPWKRVDLPIRAMRLLRDRAVRMKVVGTGEAESALREMAEGDPRIEFLGRVSDEELRALYSGANLVAFTPKREDYGYITLEAFASAKPVVTCNDSGEAANLVKDGRNGLVSAPGPQALCDAFERLLAQPQQAAAMGKAGEEWVRSLSWTRIAERLVSAGMQ
ncbi:glycosyltransferase family 4 protein [Pseudoxanthomonas sp. F11]|uniref:glycosyltransferase family 4 protein n=1 Tax=Pseudoxanthomonas sp. F11 TaxID=3126308 RepID=UPI00300C2DD2